MLLVGQQNISLGSWAALSKLIMLTNSPGEVGGWFIPLARSIKILYPELEIIAVLLPCQYASGTEARVLEETKLFSIVVDRKDILEFILRPSIEDNKKLILQLGGDPYWGTLLKIRLKSKLFIYTDGMVHINRWVDRILLGNKDPHIKEDSKVIYVGNLVVDSIPSGISNRMEGTDIAFLPGSRPNILEMIFPLMLESADILSNFTNSIIKFIVSPFISIEELKRCVPNHYEIMRDRIISGSGHIFYLEKGENWEWVKEVQLAINIPGTNTLQLALLKIPQITILPLQWAEYIPIEGIIEWMSKLPWIGKRIKRKIVYKIIPRIKFIAFPNMISREKITEELIGELTPKSIAQKILNLIRDKNKLIVMREKLSQIEFTRGASQKIARLVGEELYEQS